MMQSPPFRPTRPLIPMALIALVALVALVAAPSVAAAAGPPSGLNVNVQNDASEPVPVVATAPVPVVPAGPPADGEPFQVLLTDASLAFGVGGNSRGATFFDLVPEGKRAVIEFVSVTTSFGDFTSTSERSAFLRLRTEEVGVPGTVARLGVPIGKAGGFLGVSQAILLYLEHGQSLHVTLGRTNNSDAEEFFVQLSGRLVDAE